jgi:hypothetical protein
VLTQVELRRERAVPVAESAGSLEVEVGGGVVMVQFRAAMAL